MEAQKGEIKHQRSVANMAELGLEPRPFLYHVSSPLHQMLSHDYLSARSLLIKKIGSMGFSRSFFPPLVVKIAKNLHVYH